MATNNGGKQLRLLRIPTNLDAFDALPRELKEILWETTTRISMKPDARAEHAPEYRKLLHKLRVESTMRTYGPDHPQAWPKLSQWRQHMLEQKLELDL